MIRTYTAAEIVATYRRPLGTIYRLAAEHQWHRTADGRRPTLYDADDVEATFRTLDTPSAPTDS